MTLILKSLAHYWRNAYEWRRHEATLNQLPQYGVALDRSDTRETKHALRRLNSRRRGEKCFPFNAFGEIVEMETG